MSRRAAVSAIDLIHGRGFLNRWSHKSGILTPPFSLFSSKAFQPKWPKIDFSGVKELDDAIELFQKLRSMRSAASIRMYNNLMSVSVKIEQYSFALYVFDEMLRMGVPVDIYTMSIAVNCCCLLKDLYSAFAIMGFFFKRGYEPDVVIFSNLIKGLFLDDKETEAVKLFEKVLDLKLCEPNAVMILHVIDGLCKAGKVIAAHDWLRRLESSGWRPNVKAYNALIDGFCKGGKVDEALQLLSKMVGKGVSPDVFTYSIMLHGLFSKNMSIDGWKLFEDMKAQQVHPDLHTYSILLDGLCMNGEIDEALSLLRMIEVKGFTPNIVTYTSLINGLCKNGKRDVARDLFHQLPSKGLQPDVQIYTVIIESLCQEGSLEEVKRLLVEMENCGCGPDRVTYHVIIGSLLKQNELHEASSFMEEMRQKGCPADSATSPVPSRDDFFHKLMKDLAPKEIVS